MALFAPIDMGIEMDHAHVPVPIVGAHDLDKSPFVGSKNNGQCAGVQYGANGRCDAFGIPIPDLRLPVHIPAIHHRDISPGQKNVVEIKIIMFQMIGEI